MGLEGGEEAWKKGIDGFLEWIVSTEEYNRACAARSVTILEKQQKYQKSYQTSWALPLVKSRYQ